MDNCKCDVSWEMCDLRSLRTCSMCQKPVAILLLVWRLAARMSRQAILT